MLLYITVAQNIVALFYVFHGALVDLNALLKKLLGEVLF